MKNIVKTIFLADEKDTLAYGAALAEACGRKNTIVFLTGPLGAGKTTFVRGFLRAMNYEGSVKSPSYTLVEPYDLPDIKIFHFDFYRLKDPKELEFIGIQDYFSQDAICLIEWPEQGASRLPSPDLDCVIALKAQGREMSIRARTQRGQDALAKLS